MFWVDKKRENLREGKCYVYPDEYLDLLEKTI